VAADKSVVVVSSGIPFPLCQNCSLSTAGGRMKPTLVRITRIGLFTVLTSSAVILNSPAQVNTADLKGVITDPSGAVIGDARIRVENLATGLMRETVTRDSGNYTFLALPPGHYTITAEAANFRPAVARDVRLSIGQQAQFSFQLEISSLKEA